MRYRKLVILLEDEEGRHHRVLLSGTEADVVADKLDELCPKGLRTVRLMLNPALMPWYTKLLNLLSL